MTTRETGKVLAYWWEVREKEGGSSCWFRQLAVSATHLVNNIYQNVHATWPYKVLARMWSNWNSPTMPWVENGTTTLRNHLAASYKVEHTSWNSTKDIWKNIWRKNIHNNPKLEITQRWMNKQIVIYPYGGILLNNKKKKEPSIHKTTWMNFRNIILSNRNQAQRYAHCLIPFIWSSRTDKTNCGDSKQISGHLEPEVGMGFSAKSFEGTVSVMEMVLAIFLDSVNLIL